MATVSLSFERVTVSILFLYTCRETVIRGTPREHFRPLIIFAFLGGLRQRDASANGEGVRPIRDVEGCETQPRLRSHGPLTP